MSDEDLIEKEDIDINEDIIDKNKIKNKFKLTKENKKYYINWKYNSTIVSNIYWKNCI